mgnify:CR=1 FL=1
MEYTKTDLKNSLFVASGAFAGTVLLSSTLRHNSMLNSSNWGWQSLFGALGGMTAAFIGSRITKGN